MISVFMTLTFRGNQFGVVFAIMHHFPPLLVYSKKLWKNYVEEVLGGIRITSDVVLLSEAVRANSGSFHYFLHSTRSCIDVASSSLFRLVSLLAFELWRYRRISLLDQFTEREAEGDQKLGIVITSRRT
ncbi:hypothetical protein GQR58_007077 [Nymphon striatum]|nr:hypothetical protein GQR58_007077 [Nymphon striatum]